MLSASSELTPTSTRLTSISFFYVPNRMHLVAVGFFVVFSTPFIYVSQLPIMFSLCTVAYIIQSVKLHLPKSFISNLSHVPILLWSLKLSKSLGPSVVSVRRQFWSSVGVIMTVLKLKIHVSFSLQFVICSGNLRQKWYSVGLRPTVLKLEQNKLHSAGSCVSR